MVKKYRKKPVTIEALEWTGENQEDVKEFVGENFKLLLDGTLTIKTLEGDHVAKIGDYIIKGIEGEFYPCKPDIFEKTYNEAPDVICKNGTCRRAGMDFGQALAEVRTGKRISRRMWSGRGMFVVYQKAYPEGIACNKQTAEAWGLQEGDLFKCEPYLQIKMANGSHAMWVPSINDVLAEDWETVS